MELANREPLPLSNPDSITPFWSVFIPTYEPNEETMRQALESILCQGIGADEMQIEVVDDCSPTVDVHTLVTEIAGDRVSVSKTPKNLGMAGAWNACVERASGLWVHLLHQDDYVAPGFYRRLREAAEAHPLVGLIATRCFAVDENGVITGVSPRIPQLEDGGRAVECFLYMNPIQCAGVVVRRSAYRDHGGFRADLVFVLDVEFWARITASEGAVVLPDVMAYYRASKSTATERLQLAAESLRDVDRLIHVFSSRYHFYEARKAKLELSRAAFNQARRLQKERGRRAALPTWDYWKRNTPLLMKLRVRLAHFAGAIQRCLVPPGPC